MPAKCAACSRTAIAASSGCGGDCRPSWRKTSTISACQVSISAPNSGAPIRSNGSLGHLLGSVNIDNRGSGGIERAIDETVGVEPAHGSTPSTGMPVRLTIDLGVQHALEDELGAAMGRYEAKGVAGLVMDVRHGEMLAAASLPGVDPARAR